MEDRYYTPKEVSERLQVSEKTVRAWILLRGACVRCVLVISGGSLSRPWRSFCGLQPSRAAQSPTMKRNSEIP
jgi:hypothetical protein